MKYLKFASIDIGSNAIRLLFDNVFETADGPVFKKASLIRVPIRLGDDSFNEGRISDEKISHVIDCMKAFSFLMKAHDVITYKAYATSAMRDAENGHQIVEAVKMESGIEIEIISGEKEAELISSKFVPNYLRSKKQVVYVDVGGGSTELTLIDKNKKSAQDSFNIGTLRLLNGQVPTEEWTRLRNWIKVNIHWHNNIPIIGSGGNINKLINLVGNNKQRFIKLRDLELLYEKMLPLDQDERILQYMLNPDRADVIVPAMEIFIKICKYTDSSRIFVPQTGLSDGMVRTLYKEYKLALY
ncbi:MAG: exopolyphosphatase [Flavobacteriales bacterium]|nr:exopolyphosphatase [Flavobacteriales bacterium]